MTRYVGDDPTGEPLKPGSFYWVKPVFDVDFVPPGFTGHAYEDVPFENCYNHWTQQNQPARFEGYDGNGNEKWIYLGQDVDESNWWPVCWIGKEIEPT
jgi:hypothetical protein